MIKPENLPAGLLKEALVTPTLNLSILIAEANKRGWRVEVNLFSDHDNGCTHVNVNSITAKVHSK